MPKVLAILCADIHLSHKPPIGRSAEPDWYSAMARQLKQLKKLQKEYDCPVICAGDLFHAWNAPAELINFAMQELPQPFYSVPGQHDLPNHRWDDIHRSAYWTLVQAGKIIMIPPTGIDMGSRLVAYGFGWGVDVEGPELHEGFVNLAVVHAYCWKDRVGSYPGASRESRVDAWKNRLKGFDAVVFGDNHQNLLYEVPK